MPIPTGFHRVRDQGSAIVFTRTFKNSLADVWATLTKSTRSAQWIGTWNGNPKDGFVMFRLNAEVLGNAAAMRLDILDCRTQHTLRIVASEEPAPWDVIIELERSDLGNTHVTLNHIVTDPEMVSSMGPGWEYFLDRLDAFLRRKDPDELLWEDYFPAMEQHYVAIAQSLPPLS